MYICIFITPRYFTDTMRMSVKISKKTIIRKQFAYTK